MNELLAIDRLDFHEYPVSFTAAFELTDGEGLTSFGRALVYNAEFRGRVLFKKITEYKLGLRLTVRLNIAIQCDINRLIEVF